MSGRRPPKTGSGAGRIDLPAPRARTSGWVKLGTGLAVIGAEVAESVLHPAEAEGLAIADVAIPLIVGLILLITIVRGSPETVERVFRLLRWITNRPEPAVPGFPSSPSLAAAAEHPPELKAADIGPTLPTLPPPLAGSDLVARQVATLHEFDVTPERGLSRGQASAAFKKNGLDPRSSGPWVRSGYLARDGNRRWLTDKGREWADSKPGGATAGGPLTGLYSGLSPAQRRARGGPAGDLRCLPWETKPAPRCLPWETNQRGARAVPGAEARRRAWRS